MSLMLVGSFDLLYDVSNTTFEWQNVVYVVLSFLDLLVHTLFASLYLLALPSSIRVKFLFGSKPVIFEAACWLLHLASAAAFVPVYVQAFNRSTARVSRPSTAYLGTCTPSSARITLFPSHPTCLYLMSSLVRPVLCGTLCSLFPSVHAHPHMVYIDMQLQTGMQIY